MKKQTKLFTVLSAAALLTIGVSAVSMAAGWDNSTGEWRYLDSDGVPVTDTWKQANGNWFYLNSDGVMATNQLIEDNNNSNTRYYYVDQYGAMVTNSWKAVAMDDGNDGLDAEYWWYYFGSDGKAYTNNSSKISSSQFKTIGANKYTFDDQGHMLYGWLAADNVAQQDEDEYAWKNSTYYCNGWNDGHMQTGWVQLTVKNDEVKDDEDETQTYWFSFKSDGKKRTGRKKVNGVYYHFHNSYGYMLTNWAEASSSIDANSTAGQISYLNGDGSERKNKWVWAVPDEDYSKTGKDYENDEYSWWYFNKSGKLASNEIKKINGKKYAFDEAGRMLKGFVLSDASSFVKDMKNPDDWTRAQIIDGYMEDSDGNPYSIDQPDHFYFFSNDEEKDGSMKKGYQTLELDDMTAQFYFNTSSGKAATGYISKIKKYTKNGLVLAPSSDDDNNYAGVVVNIVGTGEGENKPEDLVFGEHTVDSGNLGRTILVNKAGTKVTSKGKLKDSNDGYYVVNNNGVVLEYFGSEDAYDAFVTYEVKSGNTWTSKKLTISSDMVKDKDTIHDVALAMQKKATNDGKVTIRKAGWANK